MTALPFVVYRFGYVTGGLGRRQVKVGLTAIKTAGRVPLPALELRQSDV
jgi:hypothetical protein